MRDILGNGTCVMGDTETDRTIVVGMPILMVMECHPQNGEKKTDKQEQSESSTHTRKILTDTLQ